MTSNVVLITGVADYWGTRLAERLLLEPELHIIGMDDELPKSDIKGLDFVQADVHNPALVDLLKAEEVGTVCHLKFVHSVRPTSAAFDVNVAGTQNLLEACDQADVGKMILKSSLAVYGAHPDNAAFLTEGHSLRGSRRYGYTRHLLEIEDLCRGLRHRASQLALTTLRFASIVGPNADTPMTHLLKGRWAPTLLGFDPMLQIIHEDDVIEALTHAALDGRPGAFNVAAEEAMPLSRVVALAGALSLPIFHPLAYWGARVLGSAGLDLEQYAPIEPDYLRYSWVGDLTKMRQELGFVPSYTAEETLREFASLRQPGRYKSPSEAMAFDEARLRATIDRRRRAKARQTQKTAKGKVDE